MGMTPGDVSEKQEAIVSRFAALMGTRTGSGDDGDVEPSSSAKEKELFSCFSRALNDSDVVCTLPSLDIKLDEDGEDPLPEVGQHMETENSKNQTSHPVMEASVLSSAADASANAAKMEQKAAQRLCSITSWTKSSIIYAAEALSKNVSKSFSSLIGSRVRSWTLLMFRHSLSSGDPASRTRLLSMLSASIKIKSSVSSFKTLPLPDSCKGQPKEADVILPLLFEVVMEVSVQDRTDTITLRAPGTISGKIWVVILGVLCIVVPKNNGLTFPLFIFSILRLREPEGNDKGKYKAGCWCSSGFHGGSGAPFCV